MRITDLPFAVLRFQYRLARTPLRLLENTVMTRFDDEAPAKLLYERAIGAVDASAGSFLRDSELEQQGIVRIEKAAALGEALRLDEVADQKKQQAADELREKREKAATAPQEAGRQARQRMQNAQEKADKRTQDVAQSVASRTAEAKREVDQAAGQKVEAAEQAKRSAQNRSRAAEKVVTSAADKQLDDAASKRSAAAGARAHADRLEEFSETEKEKRQAAGKRDL
ncbi:IF2 family translation initiation factor [Mycobacterium sp. 4D054]|uniref:IF2 family translation initiation factor n=1 Tax=Mycobacterium sp. 4D054 TaxID=3457440 RepID=UPI003FD3A5E1